MEISLVVRADTSKIRHILDFLDREGIEPTVGNLETSLANTPVEIPDSSLERFVKSLSESGRRFVLAVATRSARAERLWRPDLAQLLGFDREDLVDGGLNGVTGSVGVRWRQVVGTPNPLQGTWDNAGREHYYRIDQDLASRLLQFLEAGDDKQAPTTRADYTRLVAYLGQISPAVGSVELDFSADLEQILRNPLPNSARRHRAWWSNSSTHSQARAWLSAGWRVAKVDFDLSKVWFERV